MKPDDILLHLPEGLDDEDLHKFVAEHIDDVSQATCMMLRCSVLYSLTRHEARRIDAIVAPLGMSMITGKCRVAQGSFGRIAKLEPKINASSFLVRPYPQNSIHPIGCHRKRRARACWISVSAKCLLASSVFAVLTLRTVLYGRAMPAVR
jgi:hypothetical protein